MMDDVNNAHEPFFVPLSEGDDEQAYINIAKIIGAAPAPPGERIQSIEFDHDGGVWIATVGQNLRGTETKMRVRNKIRRAVTRQLPDGPMIVAIYPGQPWMIFTGGGRGWNQPIYVGSPRNIRRFA